MVNNAGGKFVVFGVSDIAPSLQPAVERTKTLFTMKCNFSQKARPENKICSTTPKHWAELEFEQIYDAFTSN